MWRRCVFDGRGLAGTVRAEDAEDLALLDGERDAVDGRVLAIVLRELGDFDDVHASSIAIGPRHLIGGAARSGGVFGWARHQPNG